MQNSKLYSVLKDFNKYEQNRCRKYVLSPYFNRSEKIVELFEFFIYRINSEENEDVAKEKIWYALHPDQAFNDTRWRKYCSDLLKLIEGYLAQEEYEGDKSAQIAYLMDASVKKEINLIGKNAVKKSTSFLKGTHYLNQEWYYKNYFLEKKRYRLQRSDRQRAEISNIENIINNLDNFYLFEKLRYYCDILSRSSFVSHNYEVKLIDEIIEYLSKIDEEDLEPVILIYYKMVLIIKDFENESIYFQLKDLLKEYAKDFPPTDASEMYTFVVNYCTRKLNSGISRFWREYFEIHQQLLEDKIIIVNGELNPAIFKNIITTGLRLGEVEWTRNFIDTYKSYLPASQRENAVTYNTAFFHFYQKDYTKVIQLLQEVEYEDFVYNLNAKQLLLRTYFETDEQDALYFLFDSFRAYLRRNNNISPKMKQHYSNLIKYTKKLSRVLPNDKKELTKIKEELSNEKNVGNRSWLLEKIAERE